MRRRCWVIVLAGGEGRRIQALSLDESGDPAPKQFCRFGHERSLLATALARAERFADRGRILISVTRAHRRWWAPALADRPRGTVIEQPAARGTAAGVLLPLLHVLAHDPHARVVLLPSDHAVEDEAILTEAIGHALAVASRGLDLVLLGITPEAPDPAYGWILPSAEGEKGSHGVAAFVEKPGVKLATGLMRAGALWNSFIVAGQGLSLLRLFQTHLPDLTVPLVAAWSLQESERGRKSLASLYERFPAHDLSRDLLSRAIGHLRVVAAPACGWTDLGTPERLRAWQEAGRSECGRVSGRVRRERAAAIGEPPVCPARRAASGTPQSEPESEAIEV